MGTEGPDSAWGGAESVPRCLESVGFRLGTPDEEGARISCGEEADPEADSHGGGMLLLAVAPHGAVPAPCGPTDEI